MEYLTMHEIAERFGVHFQTVRNWTIKGAPWYKTGKTVRFKLDEIEEWLKKGATND